MSTLSLLLLCLLLPVHPSSSFSLKNCTVQAGGASPDVWVDCSCRQLLVVPDDLPRDATVVKLGYNRLRQVRRSDGEGLTRLKVLYLSMNVIVHIQDGSFVHMGSLEELHLDQNRLSQLTENLFEGLSELLYLDLSSNSIRSIHPSSFQPLSRLQTVHLSDNMLKELREVQPLLSLVGLKNVSLGNNLISRFLSEELLLERPSSIRVLDVSRSSFEAFSLSAATFPQLDMLDLSSSVFRWNVTERTSLPNLTQLHFSQAGNSSQQVQEVLKNVASLKRLRMNYVDQWIQEGLLATVCRISSLRTLELFFNRVSNLSAKVASCSELLHLDLSCSEVSQVPPGSFRLMKQLRHLNLETNFLKKVPEDIRSLSSLQVLNLDDNLISEVSCEDLSNTSALVELHLSSNHMVSLLQCSFQNLLDLQLLDLSNNLLWTVEGVFSRGPARLQVLDLSKNSVPQYEDGFFQSLEQLEHLDVSSDKVVRVTPGVFLGLHSLKSLHVTIPLDYECDFRGLRQLKTLTISMTTDQSRPPPRFPPVLFHLRSLRSLQVYCRGFHAGIPLDVPEDLLRSMSQLEEFTADNIYLSAPGPSTFESNRRLRTLKISQTDLSGLDPELFRPLPELQSLDLSGTQISSLDFLLQVNLSSLRVLRLQDNAISVVNLTFLRFLPALATLDLTNNPLSCECLNAGFILWARTSSQTQVVNGHQYRCPFPVAKQGTYLLDLEVQFCWMDLNFLCFLSSTCLVVLTVLASFTYHFLRWQLVFALRLFLAWVYDQRKRRRGSAQRYDAFVSYNVKDELWVYQEMLPALEDQQGWRLCLHHRDFQPGESSPGPPDLQRGWAPLKV